MTNSFFASPLNDKEIIGLFGKIDNAFPQCTISFDVFTRRRGYNSEWEDLISKLSKSSGQSITRFVLTYGKYSFSYNRLHGKETPLSLITIGYNENANETPDELDFSIATLKLIGNPPPSSNSEKVLDSSAISYAKIESVLTGAVERFSDLQAEFAKETAKLRLEHESVLDGLKRELVEQREAQESSFAEERKKLEGEIDLKRQELENARKELDDRSNTHARRFIRTEMKEGIQRSLLESVYSEATLRQRWPIRFAYLVLIAAAAYLAYTSSALLNQTAFTSSFSWLIGVKASLTIISTLGLALLYLRWEIGWNNQQANYERTLASTRLDIDRASWIMESILEWNRETNTVMPQELTNALTRGLFDWDHQTEVHNSAADTLASAILGSASNLKLGPNGAEIDIRGKDLRKLENK
jgi:hypothetical protein